MNLWNREKTDLRHHRRQPCRLEVNYRTTGSFLISYSINLSKGGLFLQTAELLPEGTFIDLHFNIPNFPVPVETRAKVAWVRTSKNPERLPPGLGLHFDTLEGRIGLMIDELMKKFDGLTFMVVTSDPLSRERLSRQLTGIIHCNVLHQSAQQFVAEVFSNQVDLSTSDLVPFDLVILDLDSSGEQGLDIIKHLKTKNALCQTMAVSTHPRLIKQALNRGAVSALENPPDYQKFRQTVLDILSSPTTAP